MDFNKLTLTAKKQAETCINFKQPRLAEIQKSLDLYANVVSKALPGRFNVPIPVMGGFVDTLKSKIDDKPKIIFVENDETDYKRVQKANGMWINDSSDINGKWALKDRAAKVSAIFSGRGIYKYFAESDPEYKSNLEVVDLFDFIFEPQGGGDLDNHLFNGQMNIFKSRSKLIEGAKSGYYDIKQVMQLLASKADSQDKTNDDEHSNKKGRYNIYGLDPDTNNYVGEEVYALTEMYTSFMGKKYQVIFDYSTGIWVRAKEIKEVFKSGRQPFTSWATHEDYFNFLSKAPVDDIRLVAEAIKIIFNQSLDNIQKRNWQMRAYDSDIFPDPSQLQWRPDGLVKANNLTGKSISQGVYQFETPDNTNITVNMIEFLDGYLGKATGITADAQGSSDEKKVGIYYGNLQQVADRLGLYNKSYTEVYNQLGIRYLDGLDEHLTEDISVKVQGITGTEWEDVKRTDFQFSRMPDVNVESSSTESQIDEALNQRRSASLASLTANPALMSSLNTNWLIRQILKQGEFTDEQIRVATDKLSDGNVEILSEAAMAIKDIISGREVKMNRGATTGFVQKILDYEMDHELDPKINKKLRDYAQAHIPIAVQNMMRKQSQIMPQQAMGAPNLNPMAQSQPTPGTPGGTQARSADISEMMQTA